MDITKLNREEKEELLKLLEQKKLLLQEQVLDTFKPNEGAQAAFFKSTKRIRALIGGNGLGKTTCLVIELLYTHLNVHPHQDCSSTRHSWILIPSFEKVDDYWREIKKWCPPSKLPQTDKMGTSTIRRLVWQNGETTKFYSFDQDPEKLEGTNFDKLFLDECAPRALWVAAYRGLRNNPDYQVVMALTPISEPWLFEEIWQRWTMKIDPNIEVFVGSTYENKHLSKEFIEDFRSRLTEEEVRVRIYGEFAVLQGRVFKEFSRRTHVLPYQPWPEEWPVYCAIDPHPRKPHTAVYLGVTPDEEFCVIDEVKIEGTPDDLCEVMRTKELANKYKIVARRIDNSGSGSDWSRDSFVTHLDRWSRENKYNVRVSPMRKSEKDVTQSIQKIKLLFKEERLKVLDSCPNVIRDLELFSWADHRHPEKVGVKEQPKKLFDDFLDPLRYIIASNPIHSPTMHAISTLGGKTPYQSKLERSS